jgi:hypothetical protein
VFPRFSSTARFHFLGALVIIALAGMCWLTMIDNGLHSPGTRVMVRFGGLLVTLVLLLRDAGDRTILAYGAGFFTAFALFAMIGA